MAYNTHNPIPSSDPRDLFDNATTIDLIINSGADRVPGRFGQMLYTWGFFHRLVETAVVQIDGVIANATSQVNARRDSGIAEINQSVASVDAAEAAAKAEMEETAANLGDDLNNKRYSSYADMQADPQTRDAVVGVVDGDPSLELNGWYSWSVQQSAWVRFKVQPANERKVEKLASKMPDRFSSDLSFCVVDADGRETWLGANNKDGGPSAWAEFILRRLLGIQEVGRTGYLLALADADGRMTDIAIRETDGQFDEFVIQRMAPRIGKYLEIPADTGALFANDTYMRDGELAPVLPNMKQMSGWGASTIDEWGGNLSAMASGFGASYYNGGNGGTELQHTLAQMGAVPALLVPVGGSIPGSGGVEVTCSNVTPTAAFRATEGKLAGVDGVLSCNATTWTFTRTSSGVAVAVTTEQPFVPTQGIAHRADFLLYNLGKNDINNGKPMAEIYSNHAKAVEFSASMVKRFVAVNHFGHSGNGNPDHTARIKALNNFMLERYGPQVFDLSGYICSPQVWLDTGYTPTSNDLADQANGCLPATLSRDGIAHMNARTREAAANKLKTFISSTLKWY